MRTPVALSAAAVVTLSTVGAAGVIAAPGAAAPAQTVTKTDTASQSAVVVKTAAQSRPAAKKNKRGPVVAKHVRRYNLKKSELRQIKQSKRWAKSSKARSVRNCESNNTYRINTGNGYYGAWQFAAGTWNSSGGRRYTSYAHQAPKFAQDHIAWKLWRQSGWGPWGCA